MTKDNEEAIDVLKNDIEICTIQQKKACDTAIKALEQQKTGKWIDMSEGFSPYECSECRAVEFKKSNYCPTCGAKMIESEKKHEN